MIAATSGCTTAGSSVAGPSVSTAASSTAASSTPPADGTPPSTSSTTAATTASQAAEQVARLGYAPDPDRPGGYRPDVVLIGGGPSAVLAVGADGLSFTLDHRASGVDDLHTGSIMYASASVVGRVVTISPAGADRTMTVAPVSPTDLVDSLTFDESTPLDLDTASAVGRAGMSEVVTQQSTAPSTPGLRGTARALSEAAPRDPQPGPVAGDQSIGAWKVAVLRASGSIG
ncbi:MAG: hypothetical protein INR72_17995, partial [Williamsia herbipolensis]|nr:hypothetical protein [Williamsia herbipolensis]